MSANIEEVVEQLSKLSVLEMSELKKALEDHWGVTAAAPAAVIAAAPAAGGQAEAVVEESTDFEVTLQEVLRASKPTIAANTSIRLLVVSLNPPDNSFLLPS